MRLEPTLLDRENVVLDVAALAVLAFNELANSLSCSEPSIFWVRCPKRRSADAIAIVRGHDLTLHLFIARCLGIEDYPTVGHVDQGPVVCLESQTHIESSRTIGHTLYPIGGGLNDGSVDLGPLSPAARHVENRKRLVNALRRIHLATQRHNV